MPLYNLGSINIDHIYRVPHLPAPGETLAAFAYARGLGGKGANQSVAAARAGARTRHIGAVGPDGLWARDALAGFGVNVAQVAAGEVPTGHAIITVDAGGENSIVLYPGANHTIGDQAVAAALGKAQAGDTLLLQNETSGQVAAARLAHGRGMRVVYSAAPFDPVTVRAVLPHVTLLVLNEGEAAQLRADLGGLPDCEVIVTRGAQGADWIIPGAEPIRVPAFAVTAVDTTGAGDCFLGTLTAALDGGIGRTHAMWRANAAAALQVTREGASAAMPTAAEVDLLLNV